MGNDQPRVRRLVLVASIAIVLFGTSGCLWIAAGAAGGAALGYVYYQGKVCQCYAAGFDDVFAATHAALADLGFPALEEKREGPCGWLDTRAQDGDRIRLHLEVVDSRIPAEGPVTRVCVRVATFGDRTLSDRILAQIGAHLVPPAALAGVPGRAPASIAPPPAPGAPIPASAAVIQSPEPPLVTPPISPSR